jgi:hypothetical protein
MSGPDLATRPARSAPPGPPRPTAAQSTATAVARSAELRTSGALLLALLVTLAGLHVILDGVAWWFELALLCMVLLASAALVRRLVPAASTVAGATDFRRILPPVVSAVVMLLAVTAVFVPSTAILGIVPTGASWTAFQQLIEAGNFSIARQSLPATAVTSIMFLLCLGVGALTILADVLANTLRAPALAGAPLLVLLAVPSAVSIDITDPIVFVLAALAYLLLLRASAGRRQTALTIGLAATVVVASLVAPLLLPELSPAQNTNGTGFSSGVNPVLSLGPPNRVTRSTCDWSACRTSAAPTGHRMRSASAPRTRRMRSAPRPDSRPMSPPPRTRCSWTLAVSPARGCRCPTPPRASADSTESGSGTPTGSR